MYDGQGQTKLLSWGPITQILKYITVNSLKVFKLFWRYLQNNSMVICFVEAEEHV